MVAQNVSLEYLLAELTDAAYASALRHQSRPTRTGGEYQASASFLDLELSIWKSLRHVLERRLSGVSNAAGNPADVDEPHARTTAPARQFVAQVSRDLLDTSLALAEWQA